MHYSYEYMRKKSVTEASYDTEKIKALIEDGFEKQEMVEYNTLLENLEKLSKWCEEHDKMEFFQYYQDASIGAYYRYARSKAKTWSDEKNTTLIKRLRSLSYAGPVLAPVAAFALSALESKVSFFAENKNLLFSAAVIGTVILLLVSIGRIVVCVREEEDKKRNYYETWVRHSLCNSRLQLALSAFLLSKREDADYVEFVNNTFAVLEQNLDQFAVNMCPRGVASRAKKSGN